MRDGKRRLTRPYIVLTSLYLAALRQGLTRGYGTMFTYLHNLTENSARAETRAASAMTVYTSVLEFRWMTRRTPPSRA